MKPVHFVFIWMMLASTLALAQNPVPFVNQPLVPDAAAPGGSGFILTVNGTGFVSGATANWNNAPLVTTFVNQSQLTAIVPGVNIASAGTASVTVVNPAPGGGASNTQYFSINNSVNAVTFAESDLVSASVNRVMAVGDFNADGKLDVVQGVDSSKNGGQATCLLLGKGDGGFQASQCFGGIFTAARILVADFNGDGKLDVAEISAPFGPPEQIQIVLGNGDGTFQAPHVTPIISSDFFVGVAAADFNRDGKMDLLLFVNAEGSTNIIACYPGNGDGTFGTPITTSFAIPGSEGLALADFDGDDILDLVSLGPALYLGVGDGTFQSPQSILNTLASSLIETADLNGDGTPDLVVAQGNPGMIAVFLGNGDGTFQNAVVTATGNFASVMAVGDLNADGNVDVAVSGPTNPPPSPVLSILLGNGDGTFQSPMLRPINASPWSLFLGDFNNDGKMDLIGPSLGTNSELLSVFLQGNFPAFSSDTQSLTFTAQVPGTTSPPQLLTVTNTGTAVMTIAGISVTGANAGDFAQTNTCGSSLAVGANCQVNVTFTPRAGGTRSAAVSFNDNAPGSPQMVPLSGSAEDFTVTANSPTSQTVTPGQAANYTATVSPLLGFSQTLAFSCTGGPAGSTCTVTPSSVTLDGANSSPLNIAVITPSAVMGLAQPLSPGGPRGGSYAVILASFVFGVVVLMIGSGQNWRRCSQLRYTAVSLCVLLAGTISSCGGGSRSSSGGPTGTYTVTVTGTFATGGVTLSHSAKFTLVVK